MSDPDPWPDLVKEAHELGFRLTREGRAWALYRPGRTPPMYVASEVGDDRMRSYLRGWGECRGLVFTTMRTKARKFVTDLLPPGMGEDL